MKYISVLFFVICILVYNRLNANFIKFFIKKTFSHESIFFNIGHD
jgi:hypothetical protein